MARLHFYFDIIFNSMADGTADYEMMKPTLRQNQPITASKSSAPKHSSTRENRTPVHVEQRYRTLCRMAPWQGQNFRFNVRLFDDAGVGVRVQLIKRLDAWSF